MLCCQLRPIASSLLPLAGLHPQQGGRWPPQTLRVPLHACHVLSDLGHGLSGHPASREGMRWRRCPNPMLQPGHWAFFGGTKVVAAAAVEVVERWVLASRHTPRRPKVKGRTSLAVAAKSCSGKGLPRCCNGETCTAGAASALCYACQRSTVPWPLASCWLCILGPSGPQFSS